MEFRLLIDLEVIDHLQEIPLPRRRRLFAHFHHLQKYPANCSDFSCQDDLGRRLDVSIFDGCAIYYWTDMADHQVKVLKIISED